MTELSRRRLLARVGAAGIAMGAATGVSDQVVAQSDGSDWPQFGRNTRNTGHDPDAVAPSSTDEQWAFYDVGSIQSSPAVVDGTVFVGSDDSNLYAVDAGTGTEQWAFETGDDVGSSPAVAEGTVFVGSDDFNLYAVDAATGDQQWAFETGRDVGSSPAVVDGTVFVGSLDGRLHAVDAATGEEQWAFDAGGDVSSPAVAEGTVFVGGGLNNNLCAVDAATGEEQWAFETGGDVSSPAVAEGTVFVGGGLNLYAVDAATGEEQWVFGTAGAVPASPAVAEGTVFVGSGDGNLYAVDAATGEEQWTFETGSGVFSSPAVAEGTVFVGSSDGNLYAVDAGTGTEQWVFGTGDDAVGLPLAVAEETVFVGSSDGSLHAVGDATTPTPTATPTPTLTLTPTPTPTDPADSNGLPMEALLGGGATGVGLLALLYRARSGGESNDDIGDGPTPTAATDDPDATAARTTDGPETPADSASPEPTTAESRQRDQLGPPETVPSITNRSVTYDEIDRGEQIGAGGNADVYAAQLSDGQQVALKEPRMEGTVDVEAIERFVQEAETWDKLDDHDHIVRVVDYGDEPVPWLALEYMDAGDMSAVLATEPSFAARKWIAVSICQAVRHAHRRGVAHLDLKPANVLFRSAGESWPVPKVSDWGSAKMLLDHSNSVEGFSLNYAAPEQFAADEYGPPDDITDIYQVGAVCYELFTSEPPFEGSHARVMRSVLDNQPSPPSSIAEVPTKLDDVLLSALAKQKADRYESIIELRDALAGLSGHR